MLTGSYLHADVGNSAREDEVCSPRHVQKWLEMTANRHVYSSDFGELQQGYSCVAVLAFGSRSPLKFSFRYLNSSEIPGFT